MITHTGFGEPLARYDHPVRDGMLWLGLAGAGLACSLAWPLYTAAIGAAIAGWSVVMQQIEHASRLSAEEKLDVVLGQLAEMRTQLDTLAPQRRGKDGGA
jgi:hypothetical protein